MKPQNHTLSPISYRPPATTVASTQQREQELQHSAIASRAYTLWEKDGRPAGKDQSYWFKAEQQLYESTHRAFAQS